MAEFAQVFVDIDTQVDFMDPAGRLYVPVATELHEPIARLIQHADQTGTLVLSSLDEHEDDDPEFRQSPAHCLRDTPGQQKMPFTLLDPRLTLRPEGMLPSPPQKFVGDYRQLIFPKHTFNVFTNPHFVKVIEALDVGEYVIFGVALDYCVCELALGLLEHGHRVAVIRDGVKSVAPETGAEAAQRLSRRGARWLTSQDILG